MTVMARAVWLGLGLLGCGPALSLAVQEEQEQEQEQETETARLHRAKRLLASELGAQRIEGLQTYAEVALDSAPRERSDLVKSVARGLRDRAYNVRQEAARLFGIAFTFDAGRNELVAALDQERRLIKRFMAEVERWNRSSRLVFMGRFPELGTPTNLAGQPAYVVELTKAIAKCGGKRSIKALGDLLEQPWESQCDAYHRAAVDALIQVGTADAVEAVVDELLRSEGDVPADGSKDPRFGRLNGLRKFADEFSPVTEASLEHARASIRTLVESHGLQAPPDEPEAKEWSRWFKRIRRDLPR